MKNLKTNIEILDDQLNKCNSITQKLDFWKKEYYDVFKENEKYYDLWSKPIDKPVSQFFQSDLPGLVSKYFGNVGMTSPAMIPTKIYKKHFDNALEIPEFNSWFLIFDAHKWANEYYIPKFIKSLNNPITNELIQAELKILMDFEDKAKDLLLEGKIDIYSQSTERYPREKILKRLQANYYEGKVINYLHTKGGNTPVDVMAVHWYYKNWLIDELLKLGGRNPYKIENNSEDHFNNIIIRILEGISRKSITINNEDDLRSQFYIALHAVSTYVTAESISRDGRTDLMIRGEFGTKIMEFKIWGRNDYKSVVKQTISYLTDFEDTGYIIIINNNKKKLIEEEYLLTVKDANMNLVGNISEIRDNKSDYTYYQSEHKIKLKLKKINHYIYNNEQ